ncbi:hypothetical protein PSHT_08427 [Puccinia striiformis]|uniref:Uncharacterized protein n=1 Tax=Puccinia striiformis TaxID=27350 RepID=A0A2S4VPR9_9BASI|nr:hypothetical protein PSHT_08427 [Puccinia striiformis]
MSQEPNQVFCCYAPDLRPLAILLSTLHFSPRAVIQISDTAIHIQVEIGKILQAHAYLEKTSFSDWFFNPPKIPVSQQQQQQDRRKKKDGSGSSEDSQEEGEGDEEEEKKNSQKTYTKQDNDDDHHHPSDSVSESIPAKRKFNPDNHHKSTHHKSRKLPTSAIRISYDGEGSPLILLIEDSGVVTRCSLMTYEAEELAQMDFPVDRQMVHLIMKSDWLKSAFSQFDEKSGTEISLMFSPSRMSHNLQRHQDPTATAIGGIHPTFRIQVEGDNGTCTIDFPDDNEILDSFTCKIVDGLDPDDLLTCGFVRNSYKLSHLLKIKKALDVSSKTSLRVDDTGFMSLQLLIPLEESTTLKRKCGYVEFMCVPIEDG